MTHARPNMRARAVAMSLCALGACAPAAAQDTRLLLDGELREHRAELASIQGGQLTLRVGGSVRTSAVDAWLAILPAGDGVQSARRIPLAPVGFAPAMHQLLELTDGQRLWGRLVERDADDALLWEIPGLGEASVALDRVSRVRLVSGEREIQTPTDEDAAILLNGDALTGFVEGVGDRLRIDTGSSVLPLGWSLVREVRLANPASASSHPLLYLRDGTVVGVREPVALAGGGISARLGGAFESIGGEGFSMRGIELARDDVLAIALAPDRLAPIATLEIASVEPTEGRIHAPPPIVGDARHALLGAPDIEISGPIRVEWILPEGAIRAAGVARLPESAGLWGDYELTLSEIGNGGRGVERELLRTRLNAASTRHAFSVALDGSLRDARLVLRIESGAFGPIQDRLVLERGLILLTADSTDRR